MDNSPESPKTNTFTLSREDILMTEASRKNTSHIPPSKSGSPILLVSRIYVFNISNIIGLDFYQSIFFVFFWPPVG